jgi:hypothetical protein
MNKKKRILFLLSVMLLGPGLAAETQSDLSAAKKLTTTLDATTGTNFYRFSSAEHQSFSEFSVNPEYNLSGFLLGATAGLSKDWQGYREENWIDGTLYLKKKLYGRGAFTLGSSSLLLIPLSDESQHDLALVTALSLAPILSWDLSAVKLKHLTFSYTPSMTKYFHRYRTTYSGSTNVSFRLKQSFKFSYSPWENWAFGFSFSEAERWSYGGERKDSLYQSSLAASWSKKAYSVGVELSNEGSAYQANGTDSNVKIIDNETMMFYLSVSMSI